MGNLLKQRFLEERLPKNEQRKIILITGARQTGKTTLAKKYYPHLPYINLDAIENRTKMAEIPTDRFGRDVGSAIIDEAQKEPILFEKIKYAFDAGDLSFSVLLGSSQILFLKKIRESLAGRITLFELYPLTLAEIYANHASLTAPLLNDLLTGEPLSEILISLPSTLFSETENVAKAAQAYMLKYGGMPALLHLPAEERMEWIANYEFTYLERDLADLSRLSDLQPFRIFQKLAALRTASLLNYSELARDAGVSADSAKRYLEYLRLSYQVELVRPFYRNLSSTVIKTPKLYWLDVGIWRSIAGFAAPMSGQLYETFVMAELIKWIRTAKRQVEIFFYRTRSGMELDVLLELPQGMIGIEIKSRSHVVAKDATVMQEISTHLKEKWLGGLIVYNGSVLQKIAEPNIWAIPAWRLFSR